MPDNPRTDDVEKILSDEQAIEGRKQALIADLLKQREAMNKEFDEKLAKLGYHGNSSGKQKRSHHRKPGAASATEEAPKNKAKP